MYKILGIAQIRNILQNIELVIYKPGKVIEIWEILRIRHREEVPKNT
jgi:hypothetical protein